MSEKITRRDLATVLGSAAGIASARGQEAPASRPKDLATAAKEQLHEDSETLSKFDLPMSTEPAFQFKA